ncbi:MAG: ArsR family transcriptional regulator [Methanobacteriota archaeon]|nr:MAG: ArsR family transcriptional regulator [Euryarchaeota archaeon]
MNRTGIAPLPDLEELKSRVEQIFKPLSNIVRLKILFILAEGPVSYTEILAMTGLESGSFYWHIRKMEGLYSQTPDKKYLLNETGQRVLSLILGESENLPQENLPAFLQRAMPTISKVNSAPAWFILQQSVIIYLLLASLYNAVGMAQYGLLIDFSSAGQPSLSIVQWLFLIDLWMVTAIWILFRLREGARHPPKKVFLSVLVRGPLLILPLFLPGIVIGSILLLGGADSLVSSPFFQGILILISNIIFIFFETLYLMDDFNVDFRDAWITSFGMVYLLAIVSLLIL